MTLKTVMEDIEETIGLFSESYKTIDEHGHKGHVQNIPFALKPSQQFLAGLHVTEDQHAALSGFNGIGPIASRIPVADVSIKSFSPKNTATLQISSARITRLVQSSRIYVNTDVCPAGLYSKAMQNHLVNRQDAGLSDDAHMHWQNLAVGVCHSQEIDLLVSTIKSRNGRSLTTSRKGIIEKEAPAILLLSNPTFKFKNGWGKKLDKDLRVKLIEGMYRNIFHAAISEKRHYIAMPAGGLGKSGGKVEMYFAALMKVAKEFPRLNIIYNPDKHSKKFDEALHKANLTNIARTTKNVVFIADKLTREGKPCALFNPCDSDVIFGTIDVGENWKLDKNHNFDGKNYIGATTTAALNSYGLNRQAYANIVEHSPSAPQKPSTPQKNAEPTSREHAADTSKTPHNTDKPLPTPNASRKPRLDDKPETSPEIIPPNAPIPDVNILPPTGIVADEISAHSKSVSDLISEVKSGHSSGLFKQDATISGEDSPIDVQKSHLNKKQMDDIQSIIRGLERELKSCWPYPDKDLKQIKINALNALMLEAQSHPIEDAIGIVKIQFPRVMEGSFSTRTADLLDRLEQEARGVELMP